LLLAILLWEPMVNSPSFCERIDNSSKYKKSRIVLAVDPSPRPDLKEFVKTTITLLEKHICAIKMNFHLILPLSLFEILEINELAHFYGLQSIADIKLNDINDTNSIAISYLLKMGFDAIIVNPCIGKDSLHSAVQQAHSMNGGIIALIYMSHPGAKEGFGVTVINETKNSNNQITSMYKLLLGYAYTCQVDGIVVGATQTHILQEILANQKQVPIYSPGFCFQGGEIKNAAKIGTDYFIIGRSIIRSKDPLKAIKEIKSQIYTI
jgi:orotidine-5'-phosphate decarboxylase